MWSGLSGDGSSSVLPPRRWKLRSIPLDALVEVPVEVAQLLIGGTLNVRALFAQKV
jgi:hypothetical protein